MFNGFPTEILEQMIVTSLYDVMWISHATVGGNYKRRAQLSLEAAITVIWVFDTSVWVFNKPQTLCFSCLSAPRVGSISRMHSVVCFSISMHPDLFGGL